jgi:hypothetical protein
MKKLFYIVSIFISGNYFAQTFQFPESLQKTMIAKLVSGDSLIFYQCHVETGEQQLTTTGGQTITTAPQKYTLTEKFVVKREGDSYTVNYFVSSMIALPNRKFSALKIREKPYWNYKKVREKTLSEKDLKILGAVELKGHEPNEYEFSVTKDIPNQIIIRQRKNFKQLIGVGETVLSKLIFE